MCVFVCYASMCESSESGERCVWTSKTHTPNYHGEQLDAKLKLYLHKTPLRWPVVLFASLHIDWSDVLWCDCMWRLQMDFLAVLHRNDPGRGFDKFETNELELLKCGFKPRCSYIPPEPRAGWQQTEDYES